ncbi:MAG TPA: hypothetical protein ENH23_01805 [candidate division Zixibacteria bacterium]|nr:hypothetical protein [candidate division Zixibacteria bacterium]
MKNEKYLNQIVLNSKKPSAVSGQVEPMVRQDQHAIINVITKQITTVLALIITTKLSNLHRTIKTSGCGFYNDWPPYF